MTISGKSQPDEVGSTVVGMQAACVDASAVDGLVDRNYAAVYRYAYRLSGCVATAEDITQEVFGKAIAHLHQLRQAQAERGWLMSIARREFMRWLRELTGRAEARPVPLELETALADDDQPQRLDNQDWIQAALCQLNQEARVALLMYYFEDLSYAEIAQQLQIPIGTVMSRLSRGREHLRRALELALQSNPASAHPTPTHSTSAHPAAHLLLEKHALDKSLPAAQEAKHG
ncbi:MAG: RNA polymerase sigma factor [Aureliella sp.]